MHAGVDPHSSMGPFPVFSSLYGGFGGSGSYMGGAYHPMHSEPQFHNVGDGDGLHHDVHNGNHGDHGQHGFHHVGHGLEHSP